VWDLIQFCQKEFLEAFVWLGQVETELEVILADSIRKKSEAFPKAEHIERTKYALALIEVQSPS
jgi:hypothetical protein